MLSGSEMRKLALAGVVCAGIATAACDKAPLLAPTQSTITVTASNNVLPIGGSAEITAFVVEQAGTPVPNGTTVRFITTLGTVTPVEAQTTNGVATTTFSSSSSGVAQVRAVSGLATGGEGETPSNVVEIAVGTAAVPDGGVSLRANPGATPAGGGTVELVASVVAEDGRAIEGVPVTFSSTQGTLTSTRVVTDANGEARTQLTTTREAEVTAQAAGETASVTVGVPEPDAPLSVSITTTSAAAVPGEGQLWTFTATVTPADQAEEFEWNFGDGSTATTSGPTTGHVYTANGTYTVTVTVEGRDDREASTQTQILVSGI